MTYHLDCDGCDFHLDLDWSPRAYQFEGERILRMEQQLIWCPRCNGIGIAECLGEQADFTGTLESIIESRRSAIARREISGIELESERRRLADCELELEEMLGHIAELAKRTRPEFCLRCGSEQFHAASTKFGAIPHPGCGHIPQIVSVESYCGPIEWHPHLYSIEGELLRRGYRTNRFTGQIWPIKLFWDEELDESDVSVLVEPTSFKEED